MRSYNQFCPAAHALDVIGERWTLLAIRELLGGPKRYTDLRDGLPGIGPNVLAERLRSLVRHGVVRKRRLPPPAASTVYELTELGAELRPVLRGLFEWGLHLLDAPNGDETIKASYWLPALEAAARGKPVPADLVETYEFRIGGEIVTVAAADGVIEAREGAAASADLTVHTDAATFARLGRGEISAAQAFEDGRLTFEGDPGAAERCAAIFAPAAIADGGQRPAAAAA
jgi:DNA-binding HxlR family transcriptional regulator/putative sterol carrier protein